MPRRVPCVTSPFPPWPTQQQKQKMTDPAPSRYADVTLFAISKRTEGETTKISEIAYGHDLAAALKQGDLLLKSMEEVCGVLRRAIFIVYKDFGIASVKTFNLPDWLIVGPDHHHERYETLSKLFQQGYTDSESISMLLRFPD